MSESKQSKRPRISIFWPLVLIAVGIVLLLDNLGIIVGYGSLWDNLLRLWPLVFIAMGLDNLWRRQGLAGATLLIGLGVIFLLGNFGYLTVSAWQVLFNLWPLFLIAIGFDILFVRRSLVAGVIGMLLMVAILVGSLWLMGMGTGYSADQGQAIRQELNGAERAEVIIEPGIGTLEITDMQEPDILIDGWIPANEALQITKSFELDGDQATYHLRASGGNYVFPGSADIFSWDLALNSEIPLELDVEMGVGEAQLDLVALNLSAFHLDSGVSNSTILLPAQGRLDGTIDAAIGQVVIVVPPDVGLRVHRDTAIVLVNFPPDYDVEGGVYTSPNFDKATERVDLRIDMAIGRIVIHH